MANDQDHGGITTPQRQQIKYSEKELILLRQLRREGAMTRGYPAAMLTSGLTYFWMRKVPNQPLKVVTTILAGSLAHTAGIISFYPTAKTRLLEQLPQDSQLRQMFRDVNGSQQEKNSAKTSPFQQQNTPSYLSAPSNDYPAQQSQFQPLDDAGNYQEPIRDYNEPPREYPAYQAPGDSDEETKPFNSYEELRRRNRSPHSSSYSDSVAAPDAPSPQQYADDNDLQPPMPVVRGPPKRYNKYGDEILD